MCISRSPTDFIQINSIASNASHRNEVQRWKSLQQMPISEQRKEFNKTATAHKTRALHMVNSVRSTRATDISCNCVKCIKLFYFISNNSYQNVKHIVQLLCTSDTVQTAHCVHLFLNASYHFVFILMMKFEIMQ